MIFEKAHKELLLGKKIRRKEWEPLMHLRMVGKGVKTFRGEHTNFYTNSSIIISDGWKVIDGDGTYINFLQALEELRNKKWLTCREWEETNEQRPTSYLQRS